MPNTEHLDAENAGCALNRRGFITTDYYLQSSPNSWAIGDVNGKMLFAHAATHQGEYVARTILGLEFSPYQAGPCPDCLHGSMEIMHVGLTEREAAALGGEILVSKSLFLIKRHQPGKRRRIGFCQGCLAQWRDGRHSGHRRLCHPAHAVSRTAAHGTVFRKPPQLLHGGPSHA